MSGEVSGPEGRRRMPAKWFADAAALYRDFDIVTDLGPPLTRWQRIKAWFGIKPPAYEGPKIGCKIVIRTPPSPADALAKGRSPEPGKPSTPQPAGPPPTRRSRSKQTERSTPRKA